MERPSAAHWSAVLRIWYYLLSTKDLSLPMGPSGGERNNLKLWAHSDSDWAGDIDTRRSRTGWLVFIGGAAVAWRSNLQGCHALSATEAEYVAMGDVAKEVVWWRRLFEDMCWPVDGATEIFVDNKGARLLSKHAGQFNASKHISLRYHAIRAWVERGWVRAMEVRGEDNVADILTKNAPVLNFKRLVMPAFVEN